MTALPSDLRKLLEKAIVQARQVAEDGARKALESLAIGRHEPHASMSPEDRSLRKRLRAHGRQLGDERDKQKGTQTTRRLEREVAYEHWHRMLFARFLSENGLLIEPKSKVAVTLHECKELAEEADTDPWELAASFAERMLPRIFRTDDPALEVNLPPETRNALHQLVADLPTDVFTADDSLGWTYQFWQSAEKEAVNARGEKITGETLPAVTQLFTEPYMVQFLLHNTIGAWHAGKVLAERPEIAKNASSEQELRDAVALDGYTFDYLRFVRTPLEGEDLNEGTGPWRPATGTYDGWPKQASELTVLDPCCGSGHFLVAAFDLLVHLRRAEDGTELEYAIRSVLEDNLFGLELDARCTQIAAFHLALAAWRMAQAPIDLPPLSIACSGLGPNSTKEEWLELAESAAARGGMPSDRDLNKKEGSLLSDALRTGLEHLHETFHLAPELGSLLDPASRTSNLFVAGSDQLAPLLDAVLAEEDSDNELRERAVSASGLAQAAGILIGPQDGYTLVATNFPFLGLEKQSPTLSDRLKECFEPAKRELATAFLTRTRSWLGNAGTAAVVMPSEWCFLRPHRHFRKFLLEESSLGALAFLGGNAFSTALRASPVLAILAWSDETGRCCTFDTAIVPQPEKQEALRRAPFESVDPCDWAHAPACRFTGDAEFSSADARLGDYASGRLGITAGDGLRFEREFWEVPASATDWEYLQGSSSAPYAYAGRSSVVLWESGKGQIASLAESVKHLNHSAQNWQRGRPYWGKQGIVISQMGNLCSSIYTGEIYDCRCLVIVPNDEQDLAPIAAFALSGELARAVRRYDSGLKVGSPQTLLDAPFNLEEWRLKARDIFGESLPPPHSHDPTQWLFHGNPSQADLSAGLQVGVARLLGHRWPPELDEKMRLAPESRALIQACKDLTLLADNDGIVCLSSVQGEGTAATRLREMLAAAFGAHWTAALEEDLLRAAGEHFHKGRVQPSLDVWLRDRFFEEHCALFHKRPFVWHVWDGLPDGFHALVNYHRLAGPDGEGKRTLQKLTSTYLGEWIERQRQQLAAKEEGAEARLDAATALQHELRKIQEGEPPYDLFVRWKPLHEQPIGWDPDINDGVRLNIRPFLMAKDVGKKHAGILRAKPDNTWSNKKKLGVKDRGKEPQSIRPRLQFPWFWGCDPEEHTNHRTDFGSGLSGTVPTCDSFDGHRWNNLHYSRAARESARSQSGS